MPDTWNVPAFYGRCPEGRALKRLHEEPLSPLVLLYGEERFFVRRALEILKRRILVSEDLRELLYHVFYGGETKAEDLLCVVRTMPFFGQSQLVVVYDADKLKEPVLQKLLEYAGDPSPFTTLVFVAGDKLSKEKSTRKKTTGDKPAKEKVSGAVFFNTLEKQWPQACLGFPRLKKKDRREWLRELAREKGLGRTVTAGVLDQLLGEEQVPLEILANQLEILSIHDQGGKAGPVEEALAYLLPDIPSHQSYLLTDAVFRGDEPLAVERLHRFLDQGTPPLVLLTRLVSTVRDLWRVREALERKQDLETMISGSWNLKINRDLYLRLARRIPWRALEEMILALEDKERRLKSSRLDGRIHLEELCGELVRGILAGSGSS